MSEDYETKFIFSKCFKNHTIMSNLFTEFMRQSKIDIHFINYELFFFVIIYFCMNFIYFINNNIIDSFYQSYKFLSLAFKANFWDYLYDYRMLTIAMLIFLYIGFYFCFLAIILLYLNFINFYSEM